MRLKRSIVYAVIVVVLYVVMLVFFIHNVHIERTQLQFNSKFSQFSGIQESMGRNNFHTPLEENLSITIKTKSINENNVHQHSDGNSSFTIKTMHSIDTSAHYAYGFYATSRDHLKAALVNINRIRRLNDGLKNIDYVILTNISPDEKLPSANGVRLQRYTGIPSPSGYYVDCMTKLLFFNMTQYDRVIYMDVDSLVVKSLDSLFDLPPVVLASPWAYWEDEPCFTSALLVIKPEYKLWLKIRDQIDTIIKGSRFDMDLLNVFYQHKLGVHAKTFPEVLMLPGYFLVLSSHFRERAHGRNEKREANNIYPFPDIDMLAEQAYVIHFSGQPKPWSLSKKQIKEYDSISQHFYTYNLEFKTEFDSINLL